MGGGVVVGSVVVVGAGVVVGSVVVTGAGVVTGADSLMSGVTWGFSSTFLPQAARTLTDITAARTRHRNLFALLIFSTSKYILG